MQRLLLLLPCSTDRPAAVPAVAACCARSCSVSTALTPPPALPRRRHDRCRVRRRSRHEEPATGRRHAATVEPWTGQHVAYLRVARALTKQERLSEQPQHAHGPYTDICKVPTLLRMTTRILALCTSCCALTNAQVRSWHMCTATTAVAAVNWQFSHASYLRTRRHSGRQSCLWNPAGEKAHTQRGQKRGPQVR